MHCALIGSNQRVYTYIKLQITIEIGRVGTRKCYLPHNGFLHTMESFHVLSSGEIEETWMSSRRNTCMPIHSNALLKIVP